MSRLTWNHPRLSIIQQAQRKMRTVCVRLTRGKFIVRKKNESSKCGSVPTFVQILPSDRFQQLKSGHQHHVDPCDDDRGMTSRDPPRKRPQSIHTSTLKPKSSACAISSEQCRVSDGAIHRLHMLWQGSSLVSEMRPICL